MTKLFFLIFVILVCATSPVEVDAWTHGKATSNSNQVQSIYNCSTYDTTSYTVRYALVISNCFVNTGSTGAIYVTATGEVTCGALSDVGIVLFQSFNSPFPLRGANFHGSIAGGVLTINDWITPQAAPFGIESGQYLTDAKSGAAGGIPGSGSNGSTLTITGNGVDSNHFTVSDNNVTVANELMWSLATVAATAPPPDGNAIMKGPQEILACEGGSTQLVTLAGNFPISASITNFNMIVGLMFSTEIIGGNPVQSGSWKNGQITAIAVQ